MWVNCVHFVANKRTACTALCTLLCHTAHSSLRINLNKCINKLFQYYYKMNWYYLKRCTPLSGNFCLFESCVVWTIKMVQLEWERDKKWKEAVIHLTNDIVEYFAPFSVRRKHSISANINRFAHIFWAMETVTRRINFSTVLFERNNISFFELPKKKNGFQWMRKNWSQKSQIRMCNTRKMVRFVVRRHNVCVYCCAHDSRRFALKREL